MTSAELQEESLRGTGHRSHASDQLSWLLAVLRRRWWVTALCLVLVPAAAAALSLVVPKQFTSSASLLFRDPALDQKLFGSSFLTQSGDPAREAATNVELVSLDVVAARTARLIGDGATPAGIVEAVEVTAEGQSDLVSITATTPDGQGAAALANAFARSYIAYRREADRAKISEAQNLVRRQLEASRGQDSTSAQERSLRQRATELNILASLQTGNAELAQPASIPRTPSSPRLVRNILIGVVVGFLGGLGLALLIERLDRRVRDPREIERLVGLPVLAVVPQSQAISVQPDSVLSLPAAESEAFRMLRANLRYFNVDREIHSVLVTSAASGEGKTTVAWNLATVVAATGGRALLLEADLRRPSFANYHGLQGGIGLSTLLAGQSSLADAIQQVSLNNATGGNPAYSVTVLSAGPIPPNPAELLESGRLRDLIHELETDYDLIVVDTPPVSLVADAIPLLRQVSGVIVVARLGRTTRDNVVRLRQQLSKLEAHTLGVVVNGLAKTGGEYGGYAYGYGEESTRSREPRAKVGA